MARKPTPWFQFWAADWLIDPKVKMLSHEEKGILVDLWAMMWTNDIKRGTLFLGPKIPIPDEEIAKSLHITFEKFREMEQKFVLQVKILKRGKKGELYSPKQRKFKTHHELYHKQKQSKIKTKSIQNQSVTPIELELESELESDKTMSPLFLQRTEKLKTLILQNNPSAKVKDEKWGDVVRLMVERDKRTLEQIDAVIEWSQQHTFWRKNVLSMDAVRRQFDKLTMDMKEAKRGRESNICPACHKLMADQGDHWFCSDCRQKYKKAV